MSGRSWLALIIVVVGVLAIVAGIVYLVEPAHSLPSFFPGHVVAHGAGKRSKRGAAALIVGIVLVIAGVVVEATRPGSRLDPRRARS